MKRIPLFRLTGEAVVGLSLAFASPVWAQMDSNGSSPAGPVSTNRPPEVRLIWPEDGAAFVAPTNLLLVADAADADGSVATVEFFAGTNSLGITTNNPVDVSPYGPFRLVWTNIPTGSITLTAKATDNGGASTVSTPVNITVQQSRPDTNLPPSVQIIEPTNNAVFLTPGKISILAPASDPDGYVQTLEFFAGTSSLGVITNAPPWLLHPDGGDLPVRLPMITWTNPPPGSYVLTAKATDNGGASTVSAPVKITVKQGPPITNAPPVVWITSPFNHAVFRAPVDVSLFAFAQDQDGEVTNVEFFAGTNSLGLADPVGPSQFIPPNSPGSEGDSGDGGSGGFAQPPIVVRGLTNLYELVWTNAPAGNYSLTAQATDNGGATTTSKVVQITVVGALPPPTNQVPVVSIVATDPVAIEGTNCWTWRGPANPQPTWSDWPDSTNWQTYTNCGPQNALFTIRRVGITNADLTVTYDLGGTATNGVDYVTLPGVVTIPAGQASAQLSVVPIDDSLVDPNQTVVVTLMASTNSPPDYRLGFRRRAAAVIMDSRLPFPRLGFLSDHSFYLHADGPDGAWFRMEDTTNLVNWVPLSTNQVINGSIQFVDPDTAGATVRFYRAMPETNPPGD